MIITSGDVYTGSFQQDAMEGEGFMIYHNGDRYKGEFSQNKRHGFGKCIYKNGDRYKGLSILDFDFSIEVKVNGKMTLVMDMVLVDLVIESNSKANGEMIIGYKQAPHRVKLLSKVML